MKKLVLISLLQTCMIAGLPRSPVEGPQEVDADEAKRLVDAQMAEYADAGEGDDDGLDSKTVKELRAIAAGDGVDLKGNASKDDLIAAINAARGRAALTTELDGLDKAKLVERAKADEIDIADDADEAAIREAIVAKHFPPAK